jgi:hypothetical protein
MRKFSSYGPIDTSLYYYAPRQALWGDITWSSLSPMIRMERRLCVQTN